MLKISAHRITYNYLLSTVSILLQQSEKNIINCKLIHVHVNGQICQDDELSSQNLSFSAVL